MYSMKSASPRRVQTRGGGQTGQNVPTTPPVTMTARTMCSTCVTGKGGHGKGGKLGGKGAAVRTPSSAQCKEGTASTFKRVHTETDDGGDEPPTKKGPGKGKKHETDN